MIMRSVKELQGFTIAATDGEIGAIDAVYFDDEKWTIRHLVVDTGGWLSGRKVLISPRSVLGVNWADEVVRVDLTQQQIEDSPDIDTDRPVSRQHETEFDNYYGYPSYWAGPFLWGYAPLPLFGGTLPIEDARRRAVEDSGRQEMTERIEQERDHHLRSSKEVVGYDIQATNDAIGHVDDFLFDEEDWSIQMVVVATSNWWPGKHVLISPRRIDYVSWNDKNVVVKITREEIENSPEYDAQHPSPRETQGDLYRHFDRMT